MMKKTLFFVCAAALATACTNEEFTLDQAQNAAKGIEFQAAITGPSTVNTRGELVQDGTNYNFFWYAEQDRINIYADNVIGVSGLNQTGNGVVENWSSLSTPATYKATQSAATGKFTATADDQWIEFEGEKVANVVAAYPSTTTATAAVKDSKTEAITSVKLNVAASNSDQKVGFNQIAAPMYSISQGQKDKDYHSVGERINLSFTRPFPALAFASAAGNNDYNDILGNLSSIEVVMKGAKEDKEGFKLEASKIAAASATYDTKELKASGAYYVCNEPELTTGAATAKVTLNAGKWNSADKVYMSIYPVKREGTKAGSDATKQMTEDYTVTYDYVNVTLTKNLSSNANWNVQNAVYNVQTLDIAKDFPYIVTKDSETLLVFSGKFSDIYEVKDGNVNKANISWNNTTVAANGIKKIVSNVALTKEELAELKTVFTGLEKLTLKENTEIPAKTFNQAMASKMTVLELPKVVKYADTEVFNSLVTLDLNSYEFAEDNVCNQFFNGKNQSTLETLKIEAMKSFRPTFGYDRSIYFTDYTALESVALNPEGVALTANAFKGCVKLQKVTGKVDIMNAPNAFEDAGKNLILSKEVKAPVINVVNEIIPNSAFAGSQISEILFNGSQVAPKEIGESAFAENTAIEFMNLNVAEKIGKKAFNNAVKFKGVKYDETNRGVVLVKVKTLNEAILAKTAIVRVQFTNATMINGNNILTPSNAALKQIKFLATNVKTATGVNKPFGDTAKMGAQIDMFVSTTQEGVNGNDWLGYTWKSVTKENKAWGN